MKAMILSQTDWLVLPLISLVLFVALFALTCLWIFRRGAAESYRERSLLVFDDGVEGRDDE